MISKFPSANCDVAKTYDALLIGPPISVDCIPATTIPNNILLVPPILFNKLLRAVLIAPTNGLIKVVIIATNKIPKTG